MMKKSVSAILALAMAAVTAFSVSAAGADTVTKGTLLSDDDTKSVVESKEKIPMDAGTLKTENIKSTYGDPSVDGNKTADGKDDTRYSLFDDDSKAEHPTRFAFDQDNADSPAVVTWSIKDVNKPVKPGYLVLTTGYTTGEQWQHRIATEFKFYGAGADGKWVELAVAGALMQPLNSHKYCIQLVDAAEFTQYKLEVKCDTDDQNNRALQLDDLSVYAADPDNQQKPDDPQNPGDNPQNPGDDSQNPGGNPQNPGGNTGDPGKQPENPPQTGTASIVIAAVATVALAGVVIAARKRDQD